MNLSFLVIIFSNELNFFINNLNYRKFESWSQNRQNNYLQFNLKFKTHPSLLKMSKNIGLIRNQNDH